MDDTKGQKGSINSVSQIGQTITDKAIFSGDSISTFAYKKTEKLSSAIHLVTNVVPENEPLRSLLREKSLVLISQILFLKTVPHIVTQTVGTPVSTVGELVAFIAIARASGYISGMNAEILDREYRILGSVIERHTGDIVGKSGGFDEDFLHVPPPNNMEEVFYGNSKQISSTGDKGQSKGHTKATRKLINSRPPVAQAKGQTAVRHSGRIDMILKLLKGRPHASVRDVVEVIDGCSEKTIQRELASLVRSGVLKKEGERRWSTYSLV